jgi:hypothetical protein
MAPFDAAQEKRLAKAIEFHRQNPHIPKTRVAEKYTVDYSALRNRLNGHLPGNSRGGQTARLSSAEDAGLKKYLAFLTRIGMPPSKRDVSIAANYILESQGKERVSKDWPRRWLHRNKGLYKSLRSKTPANEGSRLTRLKIYNAISSTSKICCKSTRFGRLTCGISMKLASELAV